MSGVVGGCAALTAVIAVGWLVACTGTLGRDAAAVLSRVSCVVATPALLLTLADADPRVLVSPALIATAGSAVLSALLFAGLARWRWRLRPAELVAGGLASS